MKLLRIMTAALAAAAACMASGAAAQSFRADANSTRLVDLNICDPEVRVNVRGDGDTDLDFRIRNSNGAEVHSDFDLTDVTIATLNRRNNVQCEEFQLEVINIGSVWNQFEVSIETLRADITAASVGQPLSFRSNANSTQLISLNVCDPQVRVSVRGDGDTDIDFRIRNSRGVEVHSDFDLTDVTIAALDRQNNLQCEQFELEVINIGSVWNQVAVTMETTRVDVRNVSVGQPGSFRVEANSTQLVNLDACDPVVRATVRGDGDTDVDFRVRDSAGNEVHSDFDLTDVTMAVLNRRAGVQCETFQLEIINIGTVWNQVGVVMEAMQPAIRVGSQDGQNRDVGVRNLTKDTLLRIFWSNVAVDGWGDDKLGTGTLAPGQQWNVTVDDASGACRFDFKAETVGGREIELRDVNVCSASFVDFN